MTDCAGCRTSVDSGPGGAIRSGARCFHLPCAPAALLAEAQEEYDAILRKGVRYFLEKYSVGGRESVPPVAQFLELGSALATERAHRTSG
jgi:hypothetical protein